MPETAAAAARQSQRHCVLQPGVARNELPWETGPKANNPNGVVARLGKHDTTPLGLKTNRAVTQGSSCLATPGFKSESPWDSITETARTQ